MAATLLEITDEHSFTRQFTASLDDREFTFAVNGAMYEYLPGDICRSAPEHAPMAIIHNQELAHLLIGLAHNLLQQPHSHRLT